MTETDIQRYAREVAAVDLDHERNQYTTTLEYRLAHEVVRLARILDTLREPSEAVKDAVFLAVIDWYPGAYDHRNSADFSDEITSGLNAAVAAAEREVSA